jgi:hypothetical protein
MLSLRKIERATRLAATLFAGVTLAEAYYPTTIPNLIFHIDASNASTITLDGTDVIEMRNTGTVGGVAVPVSTAPTLNTAVQNSLNTISFSASPMILTGKALNVKNATVFFVGTSTRADLTGTADFVIDARSSDGLAYGLAYGLAFHTASSFYSPVQRSFYVFGKTPSGSFADAVFWKNDTYYGYSPAPPVTLDEAYVGACKIVNIYESPSATAVQIGRTYNTWYTAEFDLCEILIYSEALSTPIIEKIIEELQSKWGIS